MDTSSNSDPVGEQPQPQIPNPLAEPLLDSAGKFADDPFWDEMLDSIRRHRLELDAEWETAE
ncbi:MAG: hypothetical protein ACRYFS_08650 [Janthinobacterium lividum]